MAHRQLEQYLQQVSQPTTKKGDHVSGNDGGEFDTGTAGRIKEWCRLMWTRCRPALIGSGKLCGLMFVQWVTFFRLATFWILSAVLHSRVLKLPLLDVQDNIVDRNNVPVTGEMVLTIFISAPLLFCLWSRFWVVCIALIVGIYAIAVMISIAINKIYSNAVVSDANVVSLLLLVKKIQLSGLSRQLTHPLPPITMLDNHFLSLFSAGDEQIFECRAVRKDLYTDLLLLVHDLEQHNMMLEQLGLRYFRLESMLDDTVTLPSCKDVARLRKVVFEEVLSTCYNNVIYSLMHGSQQGLCFEGSQKDQKGISPLWNSGGFIDCIDVDDLLVGMRTTLVEISRILVLVKALGQIMRSLHTFDKRIYHISLGLGSLCPTASSLNISDGENSPIQLGDLNMQSASRLLQKISSVSSGEQNCNDAYLQLRQSLLRQRYKLEDAAMRIWSCEKLLSEPNLMKVFMHPLVGLSRAPESIDGGLPEGNSGHSLGISAAMFDDSIASMKAITAIINGNVCSEVHAGASLLDVLPERTDIALISLQLSDLFDVLRTLHNRLLIISVDEGDDDVPSDQAAAETFGVVRDGHDLYIKAANITSSSTKILPSCSQTTFGFDSSEDNLSRMNPKSAEVNTDMPIAVYVGQVSETVERQREVASLLEISHLRRIRKIGEDAGARKSRTNALISELQALMSLRSKEISLREEVRNPAQDGHDPPVSLEVFCSAEILPQIICSDLAVSLCSAGEVSSPSFLSILESRKLVNDQLYTIGDADEG
jgi:hypothetical protein